jgi:hypothetical protein
VARFLPAAGLLAGTLPFERLSLPLRLRLTEHPYVPQVAVPRSDWVATVAFPAFLTSRARYPDTGGGTVGMVGTRAGLDARAAIEVLAPACVVVTDIHQEVVTQAVHNIQANLRAPHTVQVEGRVGDLGEPFLACHVPCESALCKPAEHSPGLGTSCQGKPLARAPTLRCKTRGAPQEPCGPPWGIARCGQSQAVHALADSSTEIGVVANYTVVWTS